MLYSSIFRQWKIADFSLTCDGTMHSRSTDGGRGRNGYRPPELLREDKPSYTKETDIFGLGCILYEMAIGKQAFNCDLEVREHYLTHSSYGSIAFPIYLGHDISDQVLVFGRLGSWINQMLAKKRERRGGVSSFSDCVAHLLGGAANSLSGEKSPANEQQCISYLVSVSSGLIESNFCVGTDIPRHHDLLDSDEFLPDLVAEQRDIREAVRRQMTTRRRLFGSLHPLTLWSELCYSILCLPLSNMRHEAHSILKRVTRQYTQVYGESEYRTLMASFCLADNHYEAPERIPMLSSLLEKVETVISKDDRFPRLALICKRALGLSFLVINENFAARWLLLAVVQHSKTLLGKEHPHNVFVLIHLAEAFARTGDTSKSEQLMQEAIETQTKAKGPESLHTLISKHQYALLLFQLGQLRLYETLIREIYKPLLRLRGYDDPRVAHIRQQLEALSVPSEEES